MKKLLKLLLCIILIILVLALGINIFVLVIEHFAGNELHVHEDGFLHNFKCE